MPDNIQATPRNPLLALLADAVSGVNDYAQRPDASMPGGKANPLLALLANAVGLPAMASSSTDLSYGGSPFTGSGQTLHMKPEYVEGALAAAPLASAAFKGGLLAAKTAAPKAASMAEDYMARSGLLSPMVTWHGSPHKFDAFDASKIGTGEGAQAYGHGLYLAENPGVAEGYAKSLSTYTTTINGKPVTPDHPQFDAIMKVAARGYDKALADEKAFAGFMMPGVAENNIAAIESLKGAKIKQVQNANLYKVDLPDNMISRMLDWDKPLSQQMDALRALRQAGYSPNPEMTAGEFISSKSKEGFGPYLTDDLRKQNIPGIRYLDGSSRGAGTGTSNFVVFPGEEQWLRILERNGQPLP